MADCNLVNRLWMASFLWMDYKNKTSLKWVVILTWLLIFLGSPLKLHVWKILKTEVLQGTCLYVLPGVSSGQTCCPGKLCICHHKHFQQVLRQTHSLSLYPTQMSLHVPKTWNSSFTMNLYSAARTKVVSNPCKRQKFCSGSKKKFLGHTF